MGCVPVFFTKEQDALIIQFFKAIGGQKTAKLIGRGNRQTYRRAYELGVNPRRPSDYQDLKAYKVRRDAIDAKKRATLEKQAAEAAQQSPYLPGYHKAPWPRPTTNWDKALSPYKQHEQAGV